MYEKGKGVRLEDAFKMSDIPAAKRVVHASHEVVIRYLPNKEGILLRQVWHRPNVDVTTNAYIVNEDTYPDLRALFNSALKNGHREVQRYAGDWEPLCRVWKEILKRDEPSRSLAEAWASSITSAIWNSDIEDGDYWS